MGRFKHFILAFLACSSLLHLVHCQSQQGFISIDCGSNSSYTEPITGINYVADSHFVNTGMTMNIPTDSISDTLPKQLWNLRSFPQGTRNCYNVKVKLDTKYLIRASFLYANYDGENSIPEFEIHFGTNFWTSVKLKQVKNIIHEELIHITTSNYVQVCLVNTENGIPFISALELRPLGNASYETVSGSLASFLRLDIGAENGSSIRYPDDIYDRIWNPARPISGWTPINTSSPIKNQGHIGYIVPSSVLSTASTVMNARAPMEFSWSDPDQSNQYYVYMYFAELKVLKAKQSRLFKIYLNDRIWLKDNVDVTYLTENVVYSKSPLTTNETYNLKFIKSKGSTLPPILNAIEIFKVKNFTQSTTDQGDVDTIGSIKKIYGIAKNWQGDPCLPKTFAWEGLSCSFNSSDAPRITGLDLSSTGLTGEITIDLLNLTKLEVLDFSNNNLSGSVPDFFMGMPLLRVINLSGNNLSGQIPLALIDKKNNGSLSLSFEGNPNLYMTALSEKKKNKIVIPVVAAVGGVIIIIILIFALVCFVRRKRKS